MKQREKVKRSFKEQREYETLTQEMADLEAEKQVLTEALNSESDYQMFGAQKEVTIKIWQDATDRFEA